LGTTGCWWPPERETRKEKKVKAMIKRFFKDEQGLELSEYAIMAGIIILVTVATIILIAQHIDNIMTDVEVNLNTADTSYSP
jgi:Flp pilus assembly pilin Flp